MTQSVTDWAWSREIDHAPQKVVLAALAQACHTKYSGRISIAELALMVAHTNNGCKIILVDLVARGLVRFTCRPPEFPRQSSVVEYELLVEAD